MERINEWQTATGQVKALIPVRRNADGSLLVRAEATGFVSGGTVTLDGDWESRLKSYITNDGMYS